MNEPVNVDYLEDKLADLENDTSAVIRTIHLGLGRPSRTFTLSRKELATLRKFIFLMHYRSDAVSSTYFHENNPHNAPLADWIRNFKEARQLKTEVDVWLEGLRYYLDTPHHTIVAAGERLRERYGDNRLHEMLRQRFDPAIEEWYAVDYESLANYFFLGVWEAAEGSEFVLGGNGFGLWEGLIYGTPGAHRLYVLSPRIAIVLRRTYLHHPHSNDPSILYSCLADILIPQPTIAYASKDILKNVDNDDPSLMKSLFNAYRMSDRAQDDSFTFHITKLTSSQTYSVNEVVMMNANLHSKGSLTFTSRSLMLHTLQKYMASHNTFMGGKRALFQPLLQTLQTEMTEVNRHPSPVSDDAIRLPTFSITDTDADRQLTIFLRFILTNGLTFPSTYNRAYLVFHMATDGSLVNSVSSKIRGIRDCAKSRLISFLDPPLPSFVPHLAQPVLVETLPKEESELFFAFIGHLVDQLEVGSYSNDLLANIIYEAAIVGVTQWLVTERYDFLEDLLFPWVSILT